MGKIETLTPQQEANIIPHRDFWLIVEETCIKSLNSQKPPRQ